MTEAFWMWPLAGVLVLVGLAGTILPVLPGVSLVFAGLLVAAWADDFQRVTWLPLVLLGLLTVLSFVIDSPPRHSVSAESELHGSRSSVRS